MEVSPNTRRRWITAAILVAAAAALVLPTLQPAMHSGCKTSGHREAERLGRPWPPKN
jgi:hypothetical protein